VKPSSHPANLLPADPKRVGNPAQGHVGVLKKVVTQVGAKLGRGKSQTRGLKVSKVEDGGGRGAIHSVTLPRLYYIVNMLFEL
jgi:hypothetical protein